MKTKFWTYCIVALLGSLFTGCQTTTGPRFDAHEESKLKLVPVTQLTTVKSTSKLSPQLLRPSDSYFTLGPGDRLEIEVIGDPTSRNIVTVGPDGKIYYQLLPGVEVSGLTLGEAKKLLERELTKYIKGEPRVALTVRGIESKRVWLLGRVNAPGAYPLSGPTTLLESLSMAGGPRSSSFGATEEVADLRRSFVLRQGKVLPVNFHALLHDGDMSQNIYLHPGDIIHLPPAGASNISVLGAVAQPRTLNHRDRMSLITAIANAGGPIKYAHLGQVAIVRGSLAEPRIAVLDYRDIVKGKIPDVLLEPRDIVYVPFSPFQILGRYVDLILTTFARTVGANEGARWISPDAAVGVNVGIESPTITPAPLPAPAPVGP
jgi:polysaccharide biosynthesis/export protein